MDVSSHEPPIDQSSLLGNFTGNKVSIFDKISPFRSPATDRFSARANDVKAGDTEIVTVSSIYKKHPNGKRNKACKPGQNLTDAGVGNKSSFIVDHPVRPDDSDSSQRHPDILPSTPENQSKKYKVMSKCTSDDSSLVIKDTSTGSLPGCSVDINNAEYSPSIPSCNMETKSRLIRSRQDKITSESLSNNKIIPAKDAKSNILESSVVVSDVERSTCMPSNVEVNLPLRSKPEKTNSESMKNTEITLVKDENSGNLGSSVGVSHTSGGSNLQLHSKQDKLKSDSMANSKVIMVKDGGSDDVSYANLSSSIPSSYGESDCLHNSAADRVYRKSVPNGEIMTAQQGNSIILKTSVDSGNNEPPLSTSSSTEQFNPSLHSTLKLEPPPSLGSGDSQLLNSRHLTPPVPRDPFIRPPTPVPSLPTRDRPFRRALQSVTFNTTPDVLNRSSSSEDFPESFESSSVTSLSSVTTTSTEVDQQLLSELVKSKKAEVKVRGSQLQTQEKVSSSYSYINL